MNTQIVAALIAGGVSLVSLTGTVVLGLYGFQTTRNVTEKTLAGQQAQMLNERFATAASQLGSDKPAAVQLAGAYAMAGLADDWEKNRQTCIDVLCSYLRIPYEPDPGEDAPLEKRLAFQANREVRHTVVRVITAHLQKDVPVSWQGMDFDFSGVVFDGGDFGGAQFSGDGVVRFDGAEFSGGEVSFKDATFSGGNSRFEGATSFVGARFSDGVVLFNRTTFSSRRVSFDDATFSGGRIYFLYATFSGGVVSFDSATFSNGKVDFGGATFSGGEVSFGGATFSGGEVSFDRAEFSGAKFYFFAAFSGGEVSFGGATFSGGTVDFRNPVNWSHPPVFDWGSTPPQYVLLLPEQFGDPVS